MTYQSLYRRYRPQKFSEIKGQPHVVAALQNAVVKGQVGHAYLLHGPRGTGKTTSARVLAKALNCENRGDDGEPCGECESCIAIERGRSFDLHELDAASNNGVDAMRDLLAKVNLGTPGRVKVYILDEVHMLTSGAENALLKTLEEPPSHVIWVLATTEPHKVAPTIRSRCQVFELRLLGAEEMQNHVRWIVDDAELEVDAAAIDHVIEAGGGSVRDTLSALDGVVAAGGLVELDTTTTTLLTALADHDAAAALAAVGDATGRGTDPRRIGENAIVGLRDAFLVAMGSPPPTLGGSAKERAESLAAGISPAAFTRALDAIGSALVEMRQAPDPRVALEVTLVRLCRTATDQSIDALTERIEQLERRLDAGVVPVARSAPPVVPTIAPEPPVVPTVAPEPAVPAMPTESRASGPAAAARRALEQRSAGPASSDTGQVDSSASPHPPAAPPPVPTQPGLDPAGLDNHSNLADFEPSSPGQVVEMASRHLGLSSANVVDKANELLGPKAPGVARTSEELGRLWRVLLAEQSSPTAAGGSEETAEEIDLDDLVDAPTHADQLIEELSQAFPGAELLSTEQDDDNV